MDDNSNDNGLFEKFQAPSLVPSIINNDVQLRENTVAYLSALYNASPEPIFNRKNKLVTIVVEDGHPIIEIVDESMMKGYLTGCADFIRISSDREIGAFPRSEVVKNILSLKKWRFPKLLGLTETPVIRPDGTILTYSCYDEVTRLYYHQCSLLVPPIPDKPSRKQIKRAISLVLEPFADFPFTDYASKANAVAILLTLVLRPLFSGPVPLPLFDKPQQGTGASLLTDIISIISSGNSAPMVSPPRNEEEWKKLILSILIKGQLLCVIDNLETALQSEALSTVLTQANYEGRVLGKSEVLTLPCQTLWMCTGNNIRLGGDLARRSIWIRMDAKAAQPWLRKSDSFKHPDLKQWVTENRANLLGAILLIGRAWVLAGRLRAANPINLGGFEDWSHVIGDILAFMGVRGFLDNLESMYSDMDSEGPAWAAFLGALYEIIGDNPITTAELVTLLDNNSELSACSPVARPENKNFAWTLGKALSRKREVRYTNGFVLRDAGKEHKVVRWQVVNYLKTANPQGNPPLPASVGGSGGLETAETAQPNDSINQGALPVETNHPDGNSVVDPVGTPNNPPDPH